MRPPTLPRAIRPIRPTRRYTSTATHRVPTPAPSPAVPQPLLRELEGLYDILEGQVGGDAIWSDRVLSAVSQLENPDTEVRVGVYSDSLEGCPSAATSVVTALLLDPFAEDAATTAAIHRRHDEPHASNTGEFIIRYGDETRREINSLAVNAPWLRDANCVLIEPTLSSPSSILSTLLKCTAVILTLDPLRLFTPRLLTLAQNLAGKPLHIIVDGPLPGRSAPGGIDAAKQRILSRVHAQWNSITSLPIPAIHFLDSESGIQAIHALRRTIQPPGTESLTLPSSTLDFSAFQAPYLASNLGATSQQLLGALRALQPTSIESAEHVAEQARGYVVRVLADAASESFKVRSEAEDLRALAAHEAVLIGRASSVREGNVRAELEKTRSEVDGVLKGFRVWGTGAERIGDEVAGIVAARWGYSLAQQLAFECGQLEQIHQRVGKETEKVLKAHAHGSTPAPFYSPLLMNQLSQLDLTTHIKPTSLLPPIDARRSQLLLSAIPSIQRRALRTTMTGYATAFLSASASWTACVPLEWLDAPTASGLALLGVTASLRYALYLWTRARRAFWRDWDRVEQGLEEDVTRGLNEVIKGKVVRKAVVGAEGLEVLVRRRMEKVEEVEAALERVKRG